MMLDKILHAFAGLCLVIVLWAAYEIIPACIALLFDWLFWRRKKHEYTEAEKAVREDS